MQILEHGGDAGLGDEGLLESALDRPRNLFEYDKAPLHQLAASYAVGIIQNHPFVDGNKRTSLVVSATFLILNGAELAATEVETAQVFLDVAQGVIDEKALGEWFQKNSSGDSS